jgi:hypothetical protein
LYPDLDRATVEMRPGSSRIILSAQGAIPRLVQAMNSA